MVHLTKNHKKNLSKSLQLAWVKRRQKGLGVAWNKGLKGVIIVSKKTREIKRKQYYDNPLVPWLGKHLSDSHRKHISEALSGEKSPYWRGGISLGKRTGNKYREWRNSIFKRDNWTCQDCKKRGVYLEAHHILSWAKYPEYRYDLDNGLTLCLDCHAKTDNYRGKYGFSSNNSLPETTETK